MMAGSIDTVLTTMQNGVTAINNLGSQIGFSAFDGAWTPYTPIITALAGTFTSVSGSGRFKQVESVVFIEITVTITTNGTAAGFILATVPVNCVAAPTYFSLPGHASKSGKMVHALVVPTAALILNYDNTYPGSDGETLLVSGMYQAA